MKRTLAIILTAILTMSLAACGSEQKAESDAVATEDAATEDAATGDVATEDAATEDVAEQPAAVTEDDGINDTAQRISRAGYQYRPGQILTDSDLAILTSDKGTSLSRTLTQSEFNQIIDKFMDCSYAKDTVYKLSADGLVWKGGSRWDCSSALLYLMNYYLLTYDEAYQAAEAADPSADASSWETAALESVGEKASGAYPETLGAGPTFAVSQAMSWGNPVYTYQTIDQISADDPGDLRYGDLLFYGTADESGFKISHVAIYLGQYYLDSGDTGYYQLENDGSEKEGTREGRSDGVKISAFRAGEDLVHVARIF